MYNQKGIEMRNFKLLLLAGLPFMASCFTSCVSPSAPYSAVYYFDYTPTVQATGVHFTESYAVSFDYEALGSVMVEDINGAIKKTDSTREKEDLFAPGIYKPNDGYQRVTKSGESALTLLAEEAKRRGGDYVLNLKIEPRYSGDIDNRTIIGWEASGMVVKRK